jgi:hypothetical protein
VPGRVGYIEAESILFSAIGVITDLPRAPATTKAAPLRCS